MQASTVVIYQSLSIVKVYFKELISLQMVLDLFFGLYDIDKKLLKISMAILMGTFCK